MCDNDSIVRDLQTSLMRKQEQYDEQERELILTRGIMRTLSLSMTMNSQHRSLDEARWQDVARWLADKLAFESRQSGADYGLLAMDYLAQALEATDTSNDAGID